MQEKQVTIGDRHLSYQTFFSIGTQNPIEQAEPIRFLKHNGSFYVKLVVGYPKKEDERKNYQDKFSK